MGHRFGLSAMAMAVPFSYIAQYLFLQIRSRDYGRLTFRYGWRDSRIWKLCLQAAPIFFGNAICELNQLVDKSLLSGMETGSVTAVSYASVLYQFASNLISMMCIRDRCISEEYCRAGKALYCHGCARVDCISEKRSA